MKHFSQNDVNSTFTSNYMFSIVGHGEEGKLVSKPATERDRERERVERELLQGILKNDK